MRAPAVDWVRAMVVAGVLGAAVAINVAVNAKFPGAGERLPFIGTAVASASLMPVESLPGPSWKTAVALGLVSAGFDNIPLTALALQQGGYDWGALAYAVGFGGSMLWFGSSAGVAISNMYPEVRSTGGWVRDA